MSENKAYDYAIKLLTLRDYSESKLLAKLEGKKFSNQEISDALQSIKSRGFLREDLYVEARIKALIRKNCSVNYIRQKLAEECIKISAADIAKFFDEFGESEEEQIKKLINKKIPKKVTDPSKLLQKIVRFLHSKGHHPTKTLPYIKKILKHSSTQDDLDF